MFGGFKATLNLFGGKKNKDHFELASDLSVTGAYRVNREDSYGYIIQDVPKPTEPSPLPLRPVKSTSDLMLTKTTIPNLRNSAPVVSRDPRGAEQMDRNSIQSHKALKNQDKEHKKLEKQRLAEQKAREKQAREQAKQEKLLREREKKQIKPDTKAKKRQAPVPVPSQPQASNPVASQPQAYSTNTLDSSISRTSGPPPYSEIPNQSMPELSLAKKDKSGNVMYSSKPVDTGSWDMITQHRQQMSRPANVGAEGKRKQMVMDLNYNFGATDGNKENSDA